MHRLLYEYFVLQAQHKTAAGRQLISGQITTLLLRRIVRDFNGSRILGFGLTLLSLGLMFNRSVNVFLHLCYFRLR